jgi:hypothetical protein
MAELGFHPIEGRLDRAVGTDVAADRNSRTE